MSCWSTLNSASSSCSGVAQAGDESSADDNQDEGNQDPIGPFSSSEDDSPESDNGQALSGVG